MSWRSKCYFITGTDTGVGKSLVCAGLALKLGSLSSRIGVLKPVETGVTRRSPGDRAFLRRVLPGHIDVGSFYSFRSPVSPHLAAKLSGKRIRKEFLVNGIKAFIDDHGLTLIEGVGGLMVPLAGRFCVIDLIKAIDASVILVCPNRLGVINHTLLSTKALERNKIKAEGFFVNNLTKNTSDISRRTNCSELKKLAGVRFLGEIPYIKNVRDAKALAKAFEGVRL